MSANDNAAPKGPPRPRQYLSLDPLKAHDLPSHPDLSAVQKGEQPTLVQFLNALFAEVLNVDFDDGWKDCGKWAPSNRTVAMPALADQITNAESAPAQAVTNIPVSVDQRVKTTKDKVTWVARRSYHVASHVTYSELADLVSHEHARNEARYFAYLYDANELLNWCRQDLEQAVSQLTGEFTIHSVEMNIFQMFHIMPVSLMQDRVFHVMVVSAHSSYPGDAIPGTPFSFTVQLPIDFNSLKGSEAIMQRSHIKMTGSSPRYHFSPHAADDGAQAAENRRKRKGKKLTEGSYVSLERLQEALKGSLADAKSIPAPSSIDTDCHHRWDMMTLSTAKGVTELAPASVTQKETLKAIGGDVDHVLKYIAQERRRKLCSSVH